MANSWQQWKQSMSSVAFSNDGKWIAAGPRNALHSGAMCWFGTQRYTKKSSRLIKFRQQPRSPSESTIATMSPASAHGHTRTKSPHRSSGSTTTSSSQRTAKSSESMHQPGQQSGNLSNLGYSHALNGLESLVGSARGREHLVSSINHVGSRG